MKLHIKYQRPGPSGFNQEEFLSFYPYESTMYVKQVSLEAGLHMKLGFDWPSGFSEEDV